MLKIITGGGKALGWLIGLGAGLATISTTWFVSGSQATANARQDIAVEIVQVTTATEERIISEIIARLASQGIETAPASQALKSGTTEAAIEAIVTAAAKPSSSTIGTPPAFTETVEANVGTVYELTAKFIPYQITQISETTACIYINNGGGCEGFGRYRQLEDTGCEAAVIGTSSKTQTEQKTGTATVRIRCGAQGI